MRSAFQDSRAAPDRLGVVPPQQGCGVPAVTDAEWAVTLVREAAAARFASHASARPSGRGDAHADPGRLRSLERGGRASPLAYPTVR